MSLRGVCVGALVGLTACGSDPVPPLQTAAPGVIFTYPIDAQLDVPLGTRVVVTFSDPVVANALGSCSGSGTAITGAFCIVGPNGPLDTMAEVTGDGTSVQFSAAEMDPGTQYSIYVGAALAPTAKNLPASGPLFSFTTRTTRPSSAGPSVIAINGADPAHLADRPMYETTTIRLVFNEPLDARTVTLATGSVELVDTSKGTQVPATVVAKGIHVSIDPTTDLTAGTSYELRLGSLIHDAGGRALTATTFPIVAANSLGAGKIPQVLRTRQMMDPGPAKTRSGADRNVIAVSKPLIGSQTMTVQPGAIATDLGDPKALGGPIAFTIRRGQRLAASGLDVKLGGEIPAGLSTGNIHFEFLTDSGGRLYRNPYQPADQAPENDRSPLYVDLTFDIAVFSEDPTGNAVLAQTVLGVQATGTAIATDGVLAIEAVASMEIDLLGVTQAPTNLVLELITDPSASVATDTTPPALVASFPADASSDHPVGDGIELIFNEPIDLDRARAGGIALHDASGLAVPAVIESHGSSVVVRPLAPLPYSASFSVALSDVADVAGNPLSGSTGVNFSTPKLVGSNVPLTVAAVHPGVPCALTGATGGSPGRCAGGDGADDLYQPFTLAANEAVTVSFSQPPIVQSMVLGNACNAGTVRVEEVDAGGACVAAVPGTFYQRTRSLAFVPDQPWALGTSYRLTLISGGNKSCDSGELCGITNVAANFDPLNGTTNGDGGGPGLVLTFTGAAASDGVPMVTDAEPYTDINGSGFLDGGEAASDANRAALRIIGTTGAVSNASFQTPPCPTGTSGDACLYLLGSMPVVLGALQTNCPLPDGSTAPSCLPVTLSPQAMYGTSVTLKASVGISINTDTGTTVMRIREPASGPIMGYITDGGGTPQMNLALDLYMDAPDMSVPLSSHDLHSKPLSISLKGPVTFLPDGQIAIQLANVADVPVTVNINAPLGISGGVQMIVPMGEMKLQLISPPLRGVEP